MSTLEVRLQAQVDEAIKAFEAVGEKAAESLNQVEKANKKVAQAQRESSASARDLITGFSGLATSAFALYSAVDRVQDMQVSVSRANLQVQTSLNALEDAQRRYNAAVEKYGEDSEQARAALKDVQLAQERYNVAVERAEMMQGNLNEAMVQSALTVIPTLITMVDSGVKAFQNLHAAVDLVNKVTAFMAANPLMAAVMAIGLVAAALITAYQTCEPFRNAVNSIGEAIYNFFKPAVDAIVGALTWLWQNVVTPFTGTLKKLWKVITGNPILAALFGPITTIAYLIKNWDQVTKVLGDTWNTVTSAVSGFWNTYIKPIADFIVERIIQGFQFWINIILKLGEVWNAVCSGVSNVWNNIVMPVVNAVKWFADTIYGVFKTLFGWLIGGSVWRDLCLGIVGLWNNVVMPLVNTVKSFCEGIVAGFNWLKDALGGIWSTIVSGVQSVWNSITNTVGNAVSSTGNALTNFTSAVGNAMSSAANAIGNFINSICFAHAITKAVDTSVDELEEFNSRVEKSMEQAFYDIKTFHAAAGGQLLGPVAPLPPAPPGFPGVPTPTPVASSPTISITIQGTTEETARYVRTKLVQELRDTLIKATSTAQPTAKKIILPKTFAG